MRILHVTSDLSPGHGGPSKVTPELCRALARRGHEVTLYTTNFDVAGVLDVPTHEAVAADGFTIHYFPVGHPRRWKYSRGLWQAVRDRVAGFDVVHIHHLYLFHNVVAGHYCRKYRVPYVVSIHGALDPFIRRQGRVKKAVYHFLLENRTLNHAAAIHYTAQQEREMAHQALKIRAPGVVVPWGLNMEEYVAPPPRGRFRARHPEIGHKQMILFLSRINVVKGLDLLARSYGMIARQRPDVHLVIAGPDNEGYGRQVREWLADAGVLDRVTFTGMLRGEEKLAALRDADLFVLPSYAESFGIVVVEAMACGLPVVITNKVNIWQEVAQAQAGRVVDCDALQLASALLPLLDDAPGRAILGENGRRLVAEQFPWDRVADQMIRVYDTIMKREKT